MTNSRRKAATDGAVSGLIAGIGFGIAQLIASSIVYNLPLLPLRMAGGIVLGGQALEPTTPIAGVAIIGVLVHFALSSVFGTLFGLMNGMFRHETQVRSERQLAIGLAFGSLLWVINFQLIGRVLFPWFLSTQEVVQLFLHAVAFGIPLGLLFASAERHALPEAGTHV